MLIDPVLETTLTSMTRDNGPNPSSTVLDMTEVCVPPRTGVPALT